MDAGAQMMAKYTHHAFEFDGRTFLMTVSPFDATGTRWDASFHETTQGSTSSDDDLRVEATSKDEAVIVAEDKFRVLLTERKNAAIGLSGRGK